MRGMQGKRRDVLFYCLFEIELALRLCVVVLVDGGRKPLPEVGVPYEGHFIFSIGRVVIEDRWFVVAARWDVVVDAPS